ncbi:DUF4350 domain-containing protein [Agromyces bauzanensis]|uniref:DUF4350 domain-containing protein n=1 Tax=Agromyces bauzanensis TaxID=1308924 RepID=A0A917PCI9_9MICO|nr:DUF4350 domain-containing protein [Agromyces bauzanensis]GGJ71028.1 hypothetical protein GCM10011372_06190 [Agromyces bauzanensis]
MTVTAPSPGPSAAPAITPTLRAQVRRRRAWIVIAVVLVLGALVLLVVQGGMRAPGPALGADNPAPAGSKALVEVLRAQGVTVTEAATIDEALAGARAGSTVFLFDELGILGEERLDELSAAADRLVIAQPGFAALERLAPGVRLAGLASGPIDDVACDLRPARRADALSDGQRLLTVDDAAAASGWTGCFRDGDLGYALVSGPGASGGEVALVAATTAFTNEHVDEAGNAALALGLLGASDELVWYLPSPTDADEAAAPTIADLTPGWVTPVMVLAIAVAIVAGVWRGRRFGPLVVEQLPVQVPAGETSEGRARLYARSAARTHALDQLRIGAIERIAALLRLPRPAEVATVAEAAASATGRDAASVARLLLSDSPAHDREFVDLAADLDALEQDVRRSIRPDPDDPTRPTGRRP